MIIISQLAMSVLDLPDFDGGKNFVEKSAQFYTDATRYRLRIHLRSFTCVVLHNDGKRISQSRVHQRIETERKIIRVVRLQLHQNHLRDFYPLRWETHGNVDKHGNIHLSKLPQIVTHETQYYFIPQNTQRSSSKFYRHTRYPQSAILRDRSRG